MARLQQGVVTLRPRHGSEHIKLDAARPRQSLRNLLQQLGCRHGSATITLAVLW
jgi:hypothetical protein